MSSEWPPQRLDQIAEINPPRKVSKGSEVQFVDMAALPQLARDISLSGVVIREAKGAGAHFQNGDTLLARITPCLENGKTAQVRCLGEAAIGEGSTEFIVLCGKDPADNDYIYYLCRERAFREFAIGRMEGTSGRQRVSWQSIAAYESSFPPPDERRSAARILSALDDRITLLRETNTTLEAIAQALFKSWFVDFDPVHAKMQGRAPEGMDEATAALFPDSFEESELGAVPKGWRNVSLKEVVSIHDSKRIPLSGQERDKRKGPYSYYGAAALMDSVDDYLFDGIYLLTGEDGSVADADGYPILQYVWGKFWVNNHAHILQGKEGVSTEHVMLALQQTNITPYITGAVQAKLSQTNMWRINFTMPNREVAELFGTLLEPLFVLFRHNSEEAKTLSTLRDTLLPRLISGQLSLSEVTAETI
jgi:type I restriction enzyme S subunit